MQDALGVLFAAFGRNRLRWSELDPDWGTVVEGHRLGALSDIDADLFLRQVPIADPAVRAPIVQGAQGLPFYLDKMVPAWQALKTLAPLAHIECEADYERTTAFLNALLDLVRDDAGHPLYALVAVVGDLIEAYEIDHEPR